MKKQIIHFSLLLFLFPFLLTGQDTATTEAPLKKDSVRTIVKPFVKEVLSIQQIQINSAKYGSVIMIRVENLNDWIGTDSIRLIDTLILFINGVAMNDLIATSVNLDDQTLTFNLDRKSPSLEKLKMNFPTIYDALPVSVSIGKIRGKPIESLVKADTFSLRFVGKNFVIMSIFGVSIFILCFYILLRKSNMLRGGDDGTPYSLAQAQLAFWTLIVSISYLYIYATTQNIPEFPEKVLWLLGISITTTGGAKIIDGNKEKSQYKYTKSKTFWVDILSDNYGINIHRFQMVVWTLIMGIIFVITVIKEQKMIEFHDQLLMLMGISSGAYLGLKIPENNKPPLAETKPVKENIPVKEEKEIQPKIIKNNKK